MSNRIRLANVTRITGLEFAVQYGDNNNNSCSLKLTFDTKGNRGAFKSLILRPLRGDEIAEQNIQVEDLASGEVCCVVTLTTSNNYEDLGWILFSRFEQNPPCRSIKTILEIAGALPSPEELEQRAAVSSLSSRESKADEKPQDVYVLELGIFLSPWELEANQNAESSFFNDEQLDGNSPLAGGVMASVASEQERQDDMEDMSDEPEVSSTASNHP